MAAQDSQEFELTTGVKIRLKAPAPMAMAQAMKEVGADEPKPPMVFIEAKGREEENKADPEYRQARMEWLARAGLRAFQALVAPNTEVVSVPNGMLGSEDPDFPDLMESMGFEPGKGRFTRHAQWMQYVACGVGDIGKLSNALFRAAGVSEEDVAEAQQLFQRETERPADNGASVEPGNRPGHTVPVDSARDGAGA